MATMIVCGKEIEYTCIKLQDDEYERMLLGDSYTSVLGIARNGFYYPAEDFSIQCKKHWSISVLQTYTHNTWVIVAKHPSDVYYPMTDITQQDIYHVLEYDIWMTEEGFPVAVATTVDMD